jgi:hypothetical protein
MDHQEVIVIEFIACAEANHCKGGARKKERMVHRPKQNVFTANGDQRCDAQMIHPVRRSIQKQV